MLEVKWALLGPSGTVTKGVGKTKGLGLITKDAVAGAFRLPSLPPLFVVGAPSLIWTVEAIVGLGPQQRFWGFEVPEGSRFWVHPRGHWVGVGPEADDVEEAIKAFGAKL